MGRPFHNRIQFLNKIILLTKFRNWPDGSQNPAHQQAVDVSGYLKGYNKMEIDILKKAIDNGDQYQISIDGLITHIALKLASNSLAELNLFESSIDSNKPRMTINRKSSWFAAKYDIKRSDNSILTFRTESSWKLYYQCQCGTDVYNIYGHRKRKYSIYKNNRQIAWWGKNVISEFKGDNYRITADKGIDYNLLISFCLLIDDFTTVKSSENYTYSFDIGNIGLQEKTFDKNWTPKR